MKPLIYQRGELQRRGTRIRYDWPNAIFQAAVDGDDFVDVRLITLRNFYKDQVYNLAFDRKEITTDQYGYFYLRPVYDEAKRIMDNEEVFVQQFVEVNDDGIIVCVESEENDIAEEVLEILAQIGLTPGRTYFGKKRSYKSTELILDENKNRPQPYSVSAKSS